MTSTKLTSSSQRRLGMPIEAANTWSSTPFTPSNSTPNSRSTTTPNSRSTPSHPREEPIPFLHHAHMTFTPDELRAINASLEHGDRTNLAKLPSKLQLLRTTIIDGTQEPLAMTINRSSQFLLNIEEKQVELERADSLISLNGGEDYDPTESPSATSRAIDTTSLHAPGEVESPPVTTEELKTHVWNHSREKREQSDADKHARQFMGEIGMSIAKPAETRGRRKLLSTIHRVSGTYYEPEIPKPDPMGVLNENIYCGPKLNAYMERRCGVGRLGRATMFEK